MADEQDEWLDADAAEALLRGDRAEPDGAHDRTGARRLDAALRAVRTPGPSTGELPGEDAVLAAFREASARKRDGAARATGPAGRKDTLHTVRIGPARTAPSRRLRWTRPVRYGLAVSLAGCALGGVAVAGGTGMLSAPFGGHVAPVPASSVSTPASPRELGADLPDADPSLRPSDPSGADTPTATPQDPDEADHESGDEETGGDPAGGGGGGDHGRSDTAPGRGPSDGTDGSDGRGEADGSAGTTDPSSGAPGDSAAEAYEKSLRVCRKYRDDSLSGEDRRRLVELARGERNVERFCDRLLDHDGGGEGGTGTGDGDGGTRDGDHGPLPSVVFHPVGPAPGQEPSSLAPMPSAPVVETR
ncbi:hypothetical protein [Streptomyces sp. NPDC058330]|uniref:hypothetical protein n=1 Tax=Streptomyces sp. NPDC058330 TaxID=3346449 RepID=UPI0036E54415